MGAHRDVEEVKAAFFVGDGLLLGVFDDDLDARERGACFFVDDDADEFAA